MLTFDKRTGNFFYPRDKKTDPYEIITLTKKFLTQDINVWTHERKNCPTRARDPRDLADSYCFSNITCRCLVKMLLLASEILPYCILNLPLNPCVTLIYICQAQISGKTLKSQKSQRR